MLRPSKSGSQIVIGAMQTATVTVTGTMWIGTAIATATGTAIVIGTTAGGTAIITAGIATITIAGSGGTITIGSAFAAERITPFAIPVGRERG